MVLIGLRDGIIGAKGCVVNFLKGTIIATNLKYKRVFCRD